MSWIQTYNGIKFYPFMAEKEDIDIEDIAHSLSLICRYNGHCRYFYSVADHCIRVSEIVSQKNKLWGLLHDAAEAYLGDICSPIKKDFRIQYDADLIVTFEDMEKSLLYQIADKFQLNWYEPDGIPKEVKQSDCILASTEKRDLMTCGPKWKQMPDPLSSKIVPRSSQDSERKFLETFYLLKN